MPRQLVLLFALWLALILGFIIDFRVDGYSAVITRYVFRPYFLSLDGPPHNCTKPAVPDTLHWIWLHPFPSRFQFHQYLSALSAVRRLRPRNGVFLWYSTIPQGPWWSRLLADMRAENVELNPIKRDPKTSIFGRPVTLPEHQADLIKLEVLLELGGVYMDFDVIVVKSLRPLQCHRTTLGDEAPGKLGSSIIISAPHSRFLKLWYDSYQTFDDRDWEGHAVKMPYKLWRRHPHLLHVESRSLQHPSWMKHELPYLYGKGMYYNWKRDNYAVHLWYRFYNVDHDPESIKNLDSTVGQLFRDVYYGSPALLPAGNGSDRGQKEIYLRM